VSGATSKLIVENMI